MISRSFSRSQLFNVGKMARLLKETDFGEYHILVSD